MVATDGLKTACLNKNVERLKAEGKDLEFTRVVSEIRRLKSVCDSCKSECVSHVGCFWICPTED